MQRHHPQTMTAETLNRYAVQGVTPPTAEQLKYLAEQEIRLDEMKWGVWPNPAKNPNVLENWRGRMSHRTKAYIMAFGIHKSEATRMMMGYKRTMEAERHFDWAYARELADKEIAVRVHTKGKTVTDDIPGGDIMTKQQPVHVATPGSAHLPISKPIDDETKDRAQALDDAFDRILRQMNYVDTDHNVRRRVFRAYKNASSALQVVMHPDFMQLRAETAFIEAITEVQARKAVTNTETTSELDEAFPRCKIHNIPLEDSGKCRTCELNASMSPDEPIAKKKDPIDLAWFQFYENCKKTWGYEHDFILNEILGVSSAKATGLSPNETMKKVKAYWDAHQTAPEPPVSNGAETIATPNVVQDTPQSNEKASQMNEIKSLVSVEAQIVKSTPEGQTASTLNELPEAPFSANFKMLHPLGVEIQFTVRAAQVKDGIEKIDWLIPNLFERGYELTNGRSHTSAPVSTPNTNGNGHATASNGEGGSVGCVAIEVGTTYTGGKPALKFNCDGYELPLQFAKQPPEMIKLLSKVKHGTAPFTAEDLTVGRKFGGAWIVVWKDELGKDEKMHRNVKDVLPA